MVKKVGQISTEFIILFALLIVFLVPMAYLILQATMQSTEQVSYARINAIFSEVAIEAREVYYRGPHSRIVVSANIPNNIIDVQVVEAVNMSGIKNEYFFRIEYFAERQEQVSIIPIEVPIYTEGLLEVPDADISCIDYDCNVYSLTNFEREGLRHIQISNSYDSSSELKVKFDLVSV